MYSIFNVKFRYFLFIDLNILSNQYSSAYPEEAVEKPRNVLMLSAGPLCQACHHMPDKETLHFLAVMSSVLSKKKHFR